MCADHWRRGLTRCQPLHRCAELCSQQSPESLLQEDYLQVGGVSHMIQSCCLMRQSMQCNPTSSYSVKKWLCLCSESGIHKSAQHLVFQPACQQPSDFCHYIPLLLSCAEAPLTFALSHRFLWNLMGQLSADESIRGPSAASDGQQGCAFVSQQCPSGTVSVVFFFTLQFASVQFLCVQPSGSIYTCSPICQ